MYVCVCVYVGLGFCFVEFDSGRFCVDLMFCGYCIVVVEVF